MKKRNKMWLVSIMMGLVLSGCNGDDTAQSAVIEELPIESEVSAATEDAEKTQIVMEEKEPYEEVEVEVNGNKGSIVVGTTGAPYTELLTQAKILLAKEGWDLQIKKYDDYEKMNQDVLSGILDAHLFAHQTYVDSYNDVNGTNLVAADEVCYEVYGVYSKINQDLTMLKSGSVIGIPADATRKAHALLFMQDMGWITLNENAGMTAIMEDIAENTKNLQFKEYDSDSLSQVLEEVAYCIIGGDMAIVADLDTEEGVIKEEVTGYESVKTFTSLLVTTQENVQKDGVKALKDVLDTTEMQNYAEEYYEGAWRVLP